MMALETADLPQPMADVDVWPAALFSVASLGLSLACVACVGWYAMQRDALPALAFFVAAICFWGLGRGALAGILRRRAIR